MPPTIMNRGLIVPLTRTRRSIARLSASVPSRHTQFSVDFTTNIAESNFRYTQVFLVRVTPSPDGKDALRPVADAAMPAQTPPPDWAEIVPEMGPKPDDFLITKRQWGAFYGTELDLEFRRRGITTMVLCGIATNIGVESTARFAYEYGYHQIFAEDAMSAMSAEEHIF